MALTLFHLWAFLFIIPGVFMVLYAIRNAFEGYASQNWPPTMCTIRKSWVQVDTLDRNRKAMTPMVEYEYQFNGETQKGSRIRYGKIGSGSRTAAEKVLAPYPEGATVQLYVNPEDGKECTLEVGMAWGNVFNLVGGAVFVWCGYMILTVKK